MRAGRLIFGIILVLVGIGLVLNNLQITNIDWSLIWPWWPAIFILWGVSLMVTEPGLKLVITFLTFVVLGVLIYFGYQQQWFTPAASQSAVLTAPFNNQTVAKFRLDTGAGNFSIGGQTEQLISAKVETSLGTYKLNGSDNDYSLSLNSNQLVWPLARRVTNEVNVSLNSQPIWQVVVNTGAADVNLDLSKYKVGSLEVSTGATDMDIKLGSEQDNANVVVKTGASSLVLRVPQTTGIQVELSTGISSHDLADLEKIGDDIYQSPDYGAASKKITAKIEAGASSIELVRY